MDVLIILLFIIPGFIAEFQYEFIMKQVYPPYSMVYKLLRGLSFNVPLTAFAWFVIWYWKVVLGNDIMIQSLAQFWSKCSHEIFLLKYCLVLLTGIVILSGIFTLIHYLIRRLRKK